MVRTTLMARNTDMRWRLPLVCLLWEVAMIVLFGIFVRFNPEADAAGWQKEKHHKNITSDVENDFYFRYPSFQDVHVMIFVGFGFLMTFLQRYGFGAVGFNFLLAAFGIQWAILMQGWFHTFEQGKILIGVESLINADFCVGSVCIAFGAVLGKVSPVQLLIMTLFQVTLFSVNEYILLDLLHIRDAGGSMTIHTFGAYFGLTVATILYRPNLEQTKAKQSSNYHSDLFAMIGTLFLWMYWPSFNSAVSSHGDAQHRAVINTYCSLAACVLTTVAFSSMLQKKGKLNMPFLESRLRIQDTCGVHNLHGMPGIIGGIVGAVTAAAATEGVYGKEGQVKASTFTLEKLTVLCYTGTQDAATCGILKLPFFGDPTDENCFEDNVYWEVPGDEEANLYCMHDSNEKSVTDQ
ncbi:hypothetical protein JD844_014537 [Phrynosoma platyrhinos]|uniref:Ammonium transporter AmtB-like domain-containing protein n=1 Tax=Phrynosoma platyrhinos TaxID=52577 RepID=A0ABQ7SRX6_PHRPL|nr:hypothetical protein JD844_014537 [Phrynosoma platyrhinos]